MHIEEAGCSRKGDFSPKANSFRLALGTDSNSHLSSSQWRLGVPVLSLVMTLPEAPPPLTSFIVWKCFQKSDHSLEKLRSFVQRLGNGVLMHVVK